MSQGNQVHVPQLQNPQSRVCELQLLKPTHPKAHALQQEKPPQCEAQAPQLERSPLLAATRKEPGCSNKDPAQPKINKTRYTLLGGEV